MVPKLKYRSGYKYQVAEDWIVITNVRPEFWISSEFIELSTTGIMRILRGYAWDGPSDPAVDTPNFMAGSLLHDALYQLMREGHLPQSYRELADDEMRRINYEWGLSNPDKAMSRFRLWYTHLGVRIGGKSSASQANKRKIIEV